MKANRFLTLMVIFLTLIILTGGGLLAYKHFFAKDTSHIGTWEREIDLRGYVIEEMGAWFADPSIAGNVTFDDTAVTVKVSLTLTDDGKFSEKIDETSYNEAKKAANALAVSGLRSFLEKRLETAGTDTNAVGKSIDELIEESLSMSASQYLEEKGPILIPTLDSLREMYDKNGSYEVKDNIMKRTSGVKSICEVYFVKDDYLMFTGPGEDVFEKPLGKPISEDDTVLRMLYDYPAVYKNKEP